LVEEIGVDQIICFKEKTFQGKQSQRKRQKNSGDKNCNQ
jgi:hypothetical protein